MNTDNIGKYITAFFVLIGCFAKPALIVVAVLFIILANTHFSEIKRRKEYKEEQKPIIEMYGKKYNENDNYYNHVELAMRQHYYRSDNDSEYKKILGHGYHC